MGAIVSSAPPQLNLQEKLVSQASINVLPTGVDEDYQVPEEELSLNINSVHNKPKDVKWKLLPTSHEAKEKFQKEGTLVKTSDPEKIELRVMLDDPIAQKSLAKFAKDRKSTDIFMCWLDAHEYKSIPTPDYRRSKALHM